MNPNAFVISCVQKYMSKRHEELLSHLESISCVNRTNAMDSIDKFMHADELNQKPSLDEVIKYVREQPLPSMKILGNEITMDPKKITDEMIEDSFNNYQLPDNKEMFMKKGVKMITDISSLKMNISPRIDTFVNHLKKYIEFEVEIEPVGETYNKQFIDCIVAHDNEDMDTLQRLFKEIYPTLPYEEYEFDELYSYLMKNYFSI